LLALVIGNPRNDVWVQDLEHGTLTQRTFGWEAGQVTWTLDGQSIAFVSRRGGARSAFSVPRDGTSEPVASAFGSFSPDGQHVARMRPGPNTGTGLDLWVDPVGGPGSEAPFLQTRFTEAGPRFSPNGRWIACSSDESGQNEIYVRPYPGPGDEHRISSKGGEHVLWSHDGKEIFYRDGPKFFSVAVTLTPEFKASPPQLLFEGPFEQVPNQSYDVSPDGKRFVVLEAVDAQVAPLTHLNIVLNWFEDVKQRVGSAAH